MWKVADRETRARRHHALGDTHRLAIVDALQVSDRTPSELQRLTALPSNLLAFHLDVLEEAALIARHGSEGDRRRRYVTLDGGVLADLVVVPPSGLGDIADPVLFVCRRNSARSQLAAALWSERTGRVGLSAGLDPAPRVHPHAVEVARRHRLDVRGARPRGYPEVEVEPGLVVSVCDRAREAGIPFDAPVLHWSVPDPTRGGLRDFETAYTVLSRRIDRLAQAVAA
ncbi:MAG: helix-turn-helix domain-containing protein [Actinobacteria bacterium]|nr:helix-turn-helix domain-containing protein [Actinomycetota bacterium]